MKVLVLKLKVKCINLNLAQNFRAKIIMLPGIVGLGWKIARCVLTKTTEILRRSSFIDGSGSRSEKYFFANSSSDGKYTNFRIIQSYVVIIKLNHRWEKDIWSVYGNAWKYHCGLLGKLSVLCWKLYPMWHLKLYDKFIFYFKMFGKFVLKIIKSTYHTQRSL